MSETISVSYANCKDISSIIGKNIYMYIYMYVSIYSALLTEYRS